MNKLQVEIRKLANVYSEGEIEQGINRLLTKVYPINDYSRDYNQSLSDYFYEKALREYFVNQNISAAKQFLYLVGKATLIDICTFDNKYHIEFIVKNCMLALLSDNTDLLASFSHAIDSSYNQRNSKGSLVPCIQAVIREDWSFLQNQIEICRSTIATKNTAI